MPTSPIVQTRILLNNSSDDEDKEVHATEFVWPASAKPSTCTSLKPTQKNRQEEMKFTFDVSKCDRTFDELLRLGHLKVLIRLDQAEGAKGKNMIIGDERPLTVDNKILAREVIQEKISDGKRNLRIILKPHTLGGQGESSSGDRSAAQPRSVRPVLTAG